MCKSCDLSRSNHTRPFLNQSCVYCLARAAKTNPELKWPMLTHCKQNSMDADLFTSLLRERGLPRATPA